DCQGYVEPCEFGAGEGFYDDTPELAFGLMFHGFDYPDETGSDELHSRFWQAVMRKGILEFPRPEGCTIRRFVRKMTAKEFAPDENMLPVEQEEAAL
ncbi:MAG: type I-C CRISPR-associated protein Cas5, partial [Candidatus Electrothrix sp. EH2]|nr:type I-C CRISPR-associated protein Cas5 [Candidatus Electrothrix sp. EH2]